MVYSTFKVQTQCSRAALGSEKPLKGPDWPSWKYYMSCCSANVGPQQEEKYTQLLEEQQSLMMHWLPYSKEGLSPLIQQHLMIQSDQTDALFHKPVLHSLKSSSVFWSLPIKQTQEQQQQPLKKKIPFYSAFLPLSPQPHQTFRAWHETMLKAGLLLPRHTPSSTQHLQPLSPKSSQFRQRALCVSSLCRTSTKPDPAKHPLALRHVHCQCCFH